MSPQPERLDHFSGTCRVLVIDIDGTFLNSAKQPAAAVRAAIIRAREAGVHVCFATGRMFEAVAHWVAELGLTAPQIGNGGADVVDPGTRQRLLHRRLTPATVAWLSDQAEARGFVPVLFAGARVLARERTPDACLIARNNEFVEVTPPALLLSPDLVVEKLLYLSVERAPELPAVRERLTAAAASRPEVRFDAVVTEPGILNFSDPAATKLQAVAWVCDYLGCSLRDVVAVGDGDNDVDLLAGVGLGVAMGNATEAARAAAVRTVPDNDHDGLAVAIHEVVLPAAVRSTSAR